MSLALQSGGLRESHQAAVLAAIRSFSARERRSPRIREVVAESGLSLDNAVMALEGLAKAGVISRHDFDRWAYRIDRPRLARSRTA